MTAPTSRDPRRLAAHISLTLALCGAAIAGSATLIERWPLARELTFARASGWLAAALLFSSLSMTPLRAVMARFRRPPALLPALRRALGISAACCAILHVLYALLTIEGVWALLLIEPWLRAGCAASIALLALLITSFDTIIRRLQLQRWRALHWLVFPAAGFVTLHVLQGPSSPPRLALSLVGLLMLLIVVRLLRLRLARRESDTQSDG